MGASRRTAKRRDALLAELRADGITDERVLAAIAAVPRERFVLDEHRGYAYVNRPLPIGHDVTISQPTVVARMLELAALGPGDHVLDVGTGSGWAAAIAARLCADVVSIERVPELAERARATLAALGTSNVDVVVGDGWGGWPPRAPYDAILVAAAAPEVPAALVDELVDGGRLVLPMGEPRRRQTLVRLTRRGETVEREDVAAVRFVPLVRDDDG